MTNLAASHLSLNAAVGSDEDISDNTTAPSSVSASTHDTSRTRYHIQDLPIFAQRLEQAAARAFPNRGRSRYSKVIAVLIRWEEDDLNVQTEIDDLFDVFKNCYNFITKLWKIPSRSAHLQLMLKVTEFVEYYDSSENLMIVYYGGHGSINNARQATWMCNREPSSPTVKWSAIQSVFEESECDVLFLLDCCAAAGAAPNSGKGVIETIAACGFETWAPGPGRHSFTNALIKVLDDWRDKPSFSAAMLHAEILSVIRHDRPERRRRTDANRVENRKTPIYILTSNDPRSKSIELSVRPSPDLTASARRSTIPNTPLPNRQDTFDFSQLNRELPSGNLTVPHVLLSVALEEDQYLDIDSWVRWIRDSPALAKYVLVEGVFRSYSTMVLISLPVPLWDMLQDDLAISFIAYVESRNAFVSASENANVRIQQLVSSLAKAKLLVEELELNNTTWQQRIEKERKHAGDQYQALQKRFLAEVDARKETEAKLDELKALGGRKTKTQLKKPVDSYEIQKKDLPEKRKSPIWVPSPTTRPSPPNTVPLPIRPSTPIRPARETSRLRDDPRDVHSTAASTVESADSGWLDADDTSQRNTEYGSKSDHLLVQPYELSTGTLKMKQGSWAQVVGRGAQKGKMKETESP